MKRPYILITNDDGYDSKGIRSLWEAMSTLGDVIVVAPDAHRSGMAAAITPYPPLRAEKIKDEDGNVWYKCTGTPVDCVKLAFAQLLDRKPDLVVSGINHGPNAGINVAYSGTMGAAFEGCIQKVPSIGFSLCTMDEDADFMVAKEVCSSITKKILQEGLPDYTCLNVNIPYCKDVKGIRLCRQTDSVWIDEFSKEFNEKQEVVYPMGGEVIILEEQDSYSDLWALKEGWVAVVPVLMDRTDYSYIEANKNLFES
ncbi:MAG TPA: 5'/3'-nucleotidase SurE [Porphyromonadaceae bacterium]|nr:5'/3'-nucleotidase SurE [Porphyromonadaceae bacterium]